MSAFSLDLFLPSLFLKKVLAELSTKDIRKKGQELEKEKQEQGQFHQQKLEPKPLGKDYTPLNTPLPSPASAWGGAG